MNMTKGFPCGSAGEESPCSLGDLGSIPVLGGSPGERKGYPLQYSVLENSMDCIVHGSKESDTTDQISLSLDNIGSNNISILHGNKPRPRETLT